VTSEDYFNKLRSSSCKLICLDKLIKKFRQENKKILIFSQFTEMLLLIEEYLLHEEIIMSKIDGSTKAKD
jgi:SNF2 family DNA or RNA helicase